MTISSCIERAVIHNKEVMRALTKGDPYPNRLMGNFACDTELARGMRRIACSCLALASLCGYTQDELWYPSLFDSSRMAFVTAVCSRPLRVGNKVLWVHKANSVHSAILRDYDPVSMKCRIVTRIDEGEVQLTVLEDTIIPCEHYNSAPLSYEHLNEDACQDEHFLRWMPSTQCYILAHSMYMNKTSNNALPAIPWAVRGNCTYVIPDDLTMEAMYPQLSTFIDVCRERTGDGRRLMYIRLCIQDCTFANSEEFSLDDENSDTRSVLVNLSENILTMRVAGVTRNVELVEPDGSTLGACFTSPSSVYRSKSLWSMSAPTIGNSMRSLYLVLLYANPKRAADMDVSTDHCTKKKLKK